MVRALHCDDSLRRQRQSPFLEGHLLHFSYSLLNFWQVFANVRPREGGTLGISGWGCAAGTLESLTYTRASSAEFCYPILEFGIYPPPPPGALDVLSTLSSGSFRFSGWGRNAILENDKTLEQGWSKHNSAWRHINKNSSNPRLFYTKMGFCLVPSKIVGPS